MFLEIVGNHTLKKTVCIPEDLNAQQHQCVNLSPDAVFVSSFRLIIYGATPH